MGGGVKAVDWVPGGGGPADMLTKVMTGIRLTVLKSALGIAPWLLCGKPSLLAKGKHRPISFVFHQGQDPTRKQAEVWGQVWRGK